MMNILSIEFSLPFIDDNFKRDSIAKDLMSVLFISFPTDKVIAISLWSVWLPLTSLTPCIR